MKLYNLKVETELSGKGFFAIDLIDLDKDFAEFENMYIKQHNPYYVSCKVYIHELDKIHLLESNGFQFIENQLKLKKTIKKHNTIVDSLPYSYKKVTSVDNLALVKSIAKNTFVADRFSNDKYLDSSLSGLRYMRFVEDSFNKKDENLYALFNTITDEVVAFGSHKIVSDKEALILLGGVKNDLKSAGIGAIHDYFALNELFALGIKKVFTHISMRNKPVLHLQVNKLGYSIADSYLIFRKVYGNKTHNKHL